MANERVPLSQRIRPNSEAAQWVCDEVAELERLLEEAREAARTARAHMHSDGRCVEIVMSERDAALAQVAVLREALECHGDHSPDCATEDIDGSAYECDCGFDEALFDTSVTAHQFVQRIEREALEKAVDRVDMYVNKLHPPMGRAAAPLRAAILGEKEANDGHQDRTP